MASTSVVLPWSTCATMATLRRRGRVPRVAEDGSAGAARVEVLTSQGSPPRGPPIPGGGDGPPAAAVPIRPLTGPDNPAAAGRGGQSHPPRLAAPTAAAPDPPAVRRTAARPPWPPPHPAGGAALAPTCGPRATDAISRPPRTAADRAATCGDGRPRHAAAAAAGRRPRRASSDPAERDRAAGHVTGDVGEHGVRAFDEIAPGDVDDRPALRDERGPAACGRPRCAADPPARPSRKRGRRPARPGTRRRRAARRREPRPSSRTRPPRAGARAARAAPRPPNAPRPRAAGGPPSPRPPSRVAGVGRVHLGEGHRPAEGVVEERGATVAELDRRFEHRQRGRGDGEPAMHVAVLRRELPADHLGTRAAAQAPSAPDGHPHDRRRLGRHAVPPGGGPAAEQRVRHPPRAARRGRAPRRHGRRAEPGRRSAAR